MKIGILGCGYLGHAAATYWKEKGHYLSATARNLSKANELQSVVHAVYHLESPSFNSFFSKQEILLISVAPSSADTYASTYLETAQHVMTQVKACPNLRQIIYTSSTSVYGDYRGNWVDENTPTKPESEKAKILLETEKILLSCETSQLKVCVFRLGEIYGPGREIKDRLRRLQNQTFAGSGETYTNLVHVAQVIDALEFALIHQLSGLYNLCNDFHLLRRDFYEELCREHHIGPIKWDTAKINPHSGNKRVSNQKLKNKGFIFT